MITFHFVVFLHLQKTLLDCPCSHEVPGCCCCSFQRGLTDTWLSMTAPLCAPLQVKRRECWQWPHNRSLEEQGSGIKRLTSVLSEGELAFGTGWWEEEAEAEEVESGCWRWGKRGIAIKLSPEKAETVLFPISCLTWGTETASLGQIICSALLFSWRLLATLLGKPNYQFSQLSEEEREWNTPFLQDSN